MDSSKNTFVETLLAQKDDRRVALCHDYDKILTYVCAFLNEEGGWIVADLDSPDELKRRHNW